MRKRSRRKNKSVHSSFRSADEGEKHNQIKKGCKTCSDHTKLSSRPATKEDTLSLDLPKSPVNSEVPPNTERSDLSDYVLLDVLEKGKKLRDAMVLSVLEDAGPTLDEELLLKLDQPKETNKECYYKPLKIQKNGEVITPREEKLINDYLEGKTMKEEEEILVLNTLHGKNKEQHSKVMENDDGNSLKQESCHQASKTSRPNSGSSGKKRSATKSTCGSTTQSVSSIGIEDDSSYILKRINCFRLTVDSLTLTTTGWKKINQALDNKSKNCDVVPPPGATYFVECHFVEDSSRTQAQQWKATPLRFCSRRQIENVVYFGQSSAHLLRPPHSLASIQSELASMNCLVCWRHLNQRVPALLGNFSLAGVLNQPCLETTVSLPVRTETTSMPVAHVRLRLELGKDKLYFGRALFEDTHSNSHESKKKSTKIIEEDRIVRIKEVPLNVKDLCEPPETFTKSYSISDIVLANTKPVSEKISKERNVLPDLINIPVCTNCNQNLVLTNVQNSPDSSLCTSCSKLLGQHQGHFTETNFKISIPKNFATKELRHHEFLLGIDTVVGFPQFAGIQEELSCYVDYKFPEITSGLKAEMSRSETTSRVVGCEPQPSLSSVHRHILPLPVVLPLSPLLAACSPGVTLRLWLRYYKPTPRDHMVAMSLLPMDELCLMELEFDKKKQKSSVIKVLELPLALVPSSVTAPYQQYHNLGVLRVSVTYSNHISTPQSSKEHHAGTGTDLTSDLPFKSESHKHRMHGDVKEDIFAKGCKKSADKRNIHTLPSTKYSDSEPSFKQAKESETLCGNSTQNFKVSEEDWISVKNRFWTGPFGKEKAEKPYVVDSDRIKEAKKHEIVCTNINTVPQKSKPLQEDTNKLEPVSNIFCDISNQNDENLPHCSRPVMKEDFDILAENLEKRFNQLQSDLMKERQKGITEVDNIVMGTKVLNNCMNVDTNDDFLSFHSLSSHSSMESLPFILGPPANFKDVQNTVVYSEAKKSFSDTQNDKNVSDNMSGFLKEGKSVSNMGSNDSFDKGGQKAEALQPKTFKAKIKVDRAVNLKAVKSPSNGKKGKVPPSSWVSFGTGDCCEQNCGTGGLVCMGQRFTTPVIRRNYNPIWNLAWDVDLPIEYLQQINKRLVFRVFEENLDAAFGFASANLSILTSGLPCLSSWLSINDLAGACKGQIKIVVTPLEDVSQYQECSVFDMEEDEFEETKEKKLESVPSPQCDRRESVSFIASETEVFVNEGDGNTTKELDKEVEQLMKVPDHNGDEIEGEDPFSADDVISDYKNTLENNFRNEMAGLENLIKFLRVGSMSNELSFLRATENKENLSSNPTSQHPNAETITVASPDGGKMPTNKTTAVNNQISNQNCQRDRIFIDASTETMDGNEIASSSNQTSSEDILSKLLQQISMFQLPAVKITDNTCQTVIPETTETFTETNDEDQNKPEVSKTVHMKDASTETDDIYDTRSSQLNNGNHSYVCGELGSVLLQHFLICKPAAVKVTDSACQTVSQDKASVDSSGIFMSSQPSGMSTQMLRDNLISGMRLPEYVNENWVSTQEVQTSDERLFAIDNNIKDLERFFKENLITADRSDIPLKDSQESSSCGSLNVMDFTGAGVKEFSRSSSNATSLESCSQVMVIPRETPDGGNPPTGIQYPSNDDDSGTTSKRRGTFVIRKSKDNSDNPSTKEENGDEDLD